MCCVEIGVNPLCAEPLRTLGQSLGAGGTCPARREAPTFQADQPLSVYTRMSRAFVELESGGPPPGAFRMVGHG